MVNMKEINKSLTKIFVPFRVFYPVSATLACTSCNEKFYLSIAYRIYSILCFTTVTIGIWCQMYENFDNTRIASLKNIGFVFFLWLFYALILIRHLFTSKKYAIKKLMTTIQELDESLGLIDAAVSKKLRWYAIKWTLAVLLFQGLLIVYYCSATTEWRESAVRTFLGTLMDSEMACFSCFVVILQSRMKFFINYLKEVLEPKTEGEPERNVDILSCYRQILRILKKINKCFQTQMFFTLCFQFYFSLKNFTILISYSFDADFFKFSSDQEMFDTMVELLIALRHVAGFVVYGVLGQPFAVYFEQVHFLASSIRDADVPESTRRAARNILSLKTVSQCRLVVLGAVVDGRLPLRAFASLSTVVIVLLQLGVTSI